MSYKVFIIAAVALVAIPIVAFFFKGGSKPDKPSLNPFLERLYETVSNGPKYELLLRKIGAADQKQIDELSKQKAVLMLTKDPHKQLWWNYMGPGPRDSYPITIDKKYNWVTPDKRSVESLFTVDNNVLKEVQNWKRNGKDTTMTTLWTFSEEELKISVTLDNMTSESKCKFVGKFEGNKTDGKKPK